MSYRWVAEPRPDEGEAAALGLDQRFDTQPRAEEWLTGFYADLADAGMTAVSLYEEDRLVYGPMALDEG